MNEPENSYYWLNRDQARFPYRINSLIELMSACVNTGDHAKALAYLKELIASGGMTDELNQALIHLESALAAYMLHHPTLSLTELEEAIRLLSPGAGRVPTYAHGLAIANWFKGNLLLPFSIPATTVTSTWQHSLQLFERLAFHPAVTSSDKDWYTDRCAEMRQAIQAANTGFVEQPLLPQALLQCGNLDHFDVFDNLSMVGTSTTAAVIAPSYSIILQPSQAVFRIDGEKFQFFNLRGTRRIVVLNSRRRYLVLKVNNDSMDRVGIESDNYILIRVQETADDGDIVAVEILNGDSSAVLRYCLKDQDNIIFLPQSSDPDLQTFEFSADESSKYHIHGVVLGVFKPSAQTTAKPSGFPQEVEESAPDYHKSYAAQSDILQTLLVFSEIPAGGFKAVPKPTGGHLEVDRFWIDDRPYYLRNLLNGGRVVNPRSGKLIVLKVRGDSMNKAGIDDGDYVLLRRQNTAVNGDIVAAEIRDEESLATLKRFLTQNGKVVLKPESKNKKHKERQFDQALPGGMQPFYIQGVALAVFKLYQTDPTSGDASHKK